MRRVGLLTALLLLLVCASARADVTVNNPAADDDDGACQPLTTGDCTLREALVHTTAGEVVTVPAADYQLVSNLDVGHDLTIRGAGARTTTIHAPVQNQILVVGAGVTATVSGLTFTDGEAGDGEGGAIRVLTSGTLNLADAAVVDNHASDGDGGGIASSGTLNLNRVLVAGNGALRDGGGIRVLGGDSTIVNSTFSGNTAEGGTGGGIYAGTTLDLTNVTITGNQAVSGGGIYESVDTQLVHATNTIVAGNSDGSCAGITGQFIASYSLSEDAACLAAGGAGNALVADARLAALADNGGATLTHLPLAGSPAIDRGSPVVCPATDQRGVARPMGTRCDIGAVEVTQAPASLRVVTAVVNDSGGTSGPADVVARVRRGTADVGGSPAPGTSAGKTYQLAAGAYTVSATAPPGYAVAIGGACAPSGAVTLAAGGAKTCTITASDPAPQAHESAVAAPAGGTVKIKLPGSDDFVTLTDGRLIPLGTVVDTRRGRVTIVAAANGSGATATAEFYAGIFKLGQTKGKKPITELTLVEKLTGCKSKGKASTARKKTRKRRLWGDGKGRFRTKGKHSAATVVGTKWLVQDTCSSTLTKVARGRVKVSDFARHKTILVKAGHKYVARPRR